MDGLQIDDDGFSITHDFWRWLWWAPGDTPRAGDAEASSRTRLEWRDVVRLDATGPFPTLDVRYHTGHDVRRLAITPRRSPTAADLDRLRSLFDRAREHLEPSEVRSGWVTAPDLEWEPFERWPEEEEAVMASPYRQAPDEHEQVRAIRTPPGPYESLLQWLDSSPERPWLEHPRRVVVTDRYVCVERRDRRRVRVDRDRLRGRRRTDDGDRAYYYGRRLRLLLPLRDDACPVVWALDRDCLRIVGAD